MADISRRDFLKEAGGTAAGVALASGLAQAQDNSTKRPRNILFLMTDQHRPFAMGHVGDVNAKTPTLDDLAASGTSFHRTYCQVPVCTPSRTSILSGRYMHSHGVLQNGYMPRKELVTFPQTLRQHGYKTGCFGKLHVGNRNELDWDELDQGQVVRKAEFPDMLGGTIRGDLPLGQPAPFPLERHKEWQAKEDTIRFMRENRDEPWMIQCSMHKPHPAFQPPKEFWDQVDRDQLEVPDYPEDDLEDVNPEHLARMQQRKLENLTEDQVRDGMQGYYGNLAFCDAMFAEVLVELDRLGLREETLIVYTSDHGEMLYDHRLWTKFTFFEQSVQGERVVLLAAELREWAQQDVVQGLRRRRQQAKTAGVKKTTRWMSGYVGSKL